MTDKNAATAFSSRIQSVQIQADDFDVALELDRLQSNAAGAVALFVGAVRSTPEEPVEALELEHYPGMTESAIETIVAEACRRWTLTGVRVIHRIGRLEVGDRIVFVGVAASHRAAAFAACDFVMDYLKTRAPLWKKAHTAAGASWVESRASDINRARRWETGSGGNPP